ncbi:MAG: hypothetical protein C4527_04745 [Candidatus Omnitrophota bacterium]|jgi:hypothetical protein|nr:MAG: hypothetical protein C4527_04745 [Candidatus Omnitrophota bacterium]
MRLRCLIVDSDFRLKNKIKTVLEEIQGVQVYTEDTFQDAITIIQTQKPNLIVLRCDPENKFYERFFKLIEQQTVKTVVIPIIAEIDQDFILSLLQYSPVVDIITVDVDQNRIKAAIKKVTDKLFSEDKRSKYYRGFVGFVGIIPSLRERKILQEKNMGIIQNRSIRLAVEFWRKNPNTQMVMLTLNESDSFSSIENEAIESWEDYDLEPWKIAMFEAQNHYLEYWKEAIASDLLPVTIPTMLRRGINDLTPLPLDEQAKILINISNMKKSGQLQQALHSMGITFKLESPLSYKADFEKFTGKMQEQMTKVDEKFPYLTRPPEETGYENFKPDKAEQNAGSDDKRMAYMQKRR